ncbi:MAG: EamA family transporter [Chthoniobacter sp.]|nr:EamA family transporter [Chthoniobacter sp.]
MSEVSPEATLTASPARTITKPPLWLVLTAYAVVYVLWGSTYLGIRIAIESIPPLLMAGARFSLAGIVLYTVMRLRGAPRPQPVHWRNAAVVGAGLLLVGNGGLTWAERTVPSNIAALIIASTPLWMILFDWLRPGGHRPHRTVFAGLLLGFAGVGLIIASKDHAGHHVAEPLGAFILLAAALCWAAGSVFSRHAAQSSSALLAVAMQMIAGGTLLLLAGCFLGEPHRFDFATITPASRLAFLYLFICGSLIGFTAYVWLLQVSSPARVSTYAFVNPLIAVLLGRIVLHETLPGTVVAAAALIIAAVVLITVRRGVREPTR